MRIIDSHLHFWDLSNNINSWVNNSHEPWLKRNYLWADYQRLGQIPAGIVSLEAADGVHSLNEVQWLQTLALPLAHKHIAYIDMCQTPESFNRKLAEFKPYDLVCGFRDIMSKADYSPYSPCSVDITLNPEKLGNLAVNLTILQEKQYIFNCQMYPEQLLRIKDLICQSQVKCIIDHCGLPCLKEARCYQEWQQMLKIFATESNNCYFKLSGLEMNANLANADQIFTEIFSRFNPAKLIFGSNYPLETNSRQVLQAWLDQNQFCQLSDQVFYRNAADFFGFELN